MTSHSYGQRVSLLEYLNRNPGASLPELGETPKTLERLRRQVFDDPPHSKAQLRERVVALEARNRELKTYDLMVAHDLKDPLTILIMTADLINEVSDITGEELRQFTLQIKSIAYEMNNIIKSLLLFTEVSQAEVPVECVHMAGVVANVQARLSYMIREQQAQLVLPQVWPDAVGYGPWIEEVWANLLSNALKYGGRPPRVELGASARSDGMLLFWTRDNGPGIPPENRPHLFIPYRQISPVSKRGHGLGLSIVHSIVEKLGGEVGVESEEGQGSLFYFTLPAAAEYSALVGRQTNQ